MISAVSEATILWDSGAHHEPLETQEQVVNASLMESYRIAPESLTLKCKEGAEVSLGEGNPPSHLLNHSQREQPLQRFQPVTALFHYSIGVCGETLRAHAAYFSKLSHSC